MVFSTTNRFTNLYAQLLKKKTCRLTQGLSRFLDQWPLQNRPFPPILGKILLKPCNLKTLRSQISFFFIICIFLWTKSWIGIKCILYESWRKKVKKKFAEKIHSMCFKWPSLSPSNTLWFFSAKCFFNILKKCIWYQCKIFFTEICPQ